MWLRKVLKLVYLAKRDEGLSRASQACLANITWLKWINNRKPKPLSILDLHKVLQFFQCILMALFHQTPTKILPLMIPTANMDLRVIWNIHRINRNSLHNCFEWNFLTPFGEQLFPAKKITIDKAIGTNWGNHGIPSFM